MDDLEPQLLVLIPGLSLKMAQPNHPHAVELNFPLDNSKYAYIILTNFFLRLLFCYYVIDINLVKHQFLTGCWFNFQILISLPELVENHFVLFPNLQSL